MELKEIRKDTPDTKEFKNRAEQLFKATRTPVERFELTLKDLQEQFEKGFIGPDLLNRGIKEEKKRLAEETDKGPPKLAGDARFRGSQGAFDALAAAQKGGKKDPNKQLNANTKAMLAELKKQTGVIEDNAHQTIESFTT